MSFVLLQDNVEIIKTLNWSPSTYGKITSTSFPKEVTQDYIWENEGYWLGWIADPEPIALTKEEILAQEALAKEEIRAEAYRNESDPLFFKWQRSEVEKQAWLDKVAEIKGR